MDKRSNKTFEFQLDTEKGVLCLSDLLINTMVYLYNDNGYLQVKELCISSSLTLELPKRGTYVLVILHPASEVVVRRIFYLVFRYKKCQYILLHTGIVYKDLFYFSYGMIIHPPQHQQ